VKAKLLGLIMNKLPKTQTTFNDKYTAVVSLYRQLHYDKSLKIANELLAESPNDPFVMELKCLNLISLRRIKEAADAALQVLKKTRNNEVYRDLTLILAGAIIAGNKTEDIPEVLKYLRRVMTHHENDISIINTMGKLLSMQGDNDSAMYYAALSDFLKGEKKLSKTHATQALKSKNKSIAQKAQDLLTRLKSDS
jgi:predicted Zn-dependent protease